MVTYRQRVREIERRLGGRRLVYFGTRGTDARPLLEISNFEEIFSQIAPLEAVGIQETCLENMTKVRVDLDRYSIDQDTSEQIHKIRQGLLRAFSRPAAVIPYRPSAVLASACFTRTNLVHYLGVFHEKQSCFEHKPWLETQLASLGVRVIPWSYYADDDLSLIHEAAEQGPLVLRANRSDGGAGLSLILSPTDISDSWPSHLDGFLAAAPLLFPNIPLNVNACVFPNGAVSLHSPSVQLIGLPTCTSRRFGYCGNDFVRVADLDPQLLDELEKMTVLVGRWLASQGYIGAYGIDALIHDGTVYLTEVNPRFQGSSAISCSLLRDLDHPDLILDHIAAFLGLDPAKSLSLRILAREQPPMAHVVCHNTTKLPVRRKPNTSVDNDPSTSLFPSKATDVAPEGILFDSIFNTSVTLDGGSLSSSAEQHVANTVKQLFFPARPS